MDNGLSVCCNQADPRTQSWRLLKSHQNKMHKQANTPSEQPHWHSCSHYSQQGVLGWRRRMKNGKRNYCISSGWGLGAGGGGSVCQEALYPQRILQSHRSALWQSDFSAHSFDAICMQFAVFRTDEQFPIVSSLFIYFLFIYLSSAVSYPFRIGNDTRTF